MRDRTPLFMGSSKAWQIAKQFLKEKRPLVWITPNEASASQSQINLDFFEIPNTLFPDLGVLPYFHLSPNSDLVSERLRILYALQSKKPFILTTSLTAATRRLMPKKKFLDLTFSIRVKEVLNRSLLIEKLASLSYQRAPLVEDQGTFAVRGSIIDIFSLAYADPIRIEFFGDEIESLRFFNPDNQKSLQSIPEVDIIPAREVMLAHLQTKISSHLKSRCDDREISKGERDQVLESLEHKIYFNGIETYLPILYETTSSLFDYLPMETKVIIEDFDFLPRHEKWLQELVVYQKKSSSLERILDPKDLFLESYEIQEHMSYYESLHFDPAPIQSVEFLKKNIHAQKHEAHTLRPFAGELQDLCNKGISIYLVSGTPIQRERLKDLLHPYHLPIQMPLEDQSGIVKAALRDPSALSPQIHLLLGHLTEGFYWPEKQQLWMTDEEIFGQKIRKRPQKPIGQVFSSFEDLVPGDYVVHEAHGIGIYRGLESLQIQQHTNDFLRLEYLGGDKLFVPVDQLDRISRYGSKEGAMPLLDRMGGASWHKVRERVKKATRRLAKELLQIQAERLSAKGHAFSQGGELFEEFEATFPYEETEDQLRAISEVLRDMEEPKPMDRLVCGDVGYGKTEVAIRASFKAVLDNKQVALLVPTTILAFQHYETFKKRFEKDAIRLALLSRFQSASEQKKIVGELAQGAIDIVIGTHRLLSKDVRFHDLGLLVIDEEHRFGVRQKEWIKKFRSLVDALTLTATPIPRTLNFALSGVRDLSIINTPPADRLAIRTFVTYFDEGVIEEAVHREIQRGGQVFFVHNRIQTLSATLKKLQKILPDVTIQIAHGQMPEEDLETVMLDFMAQKFQLLLCTSIIESGLDIPNANTILINRADHFGLAQLYQLRGRVGRSNRRAYCYLLIPQDSLITDIAKKRLSVIERFTELGSGFKIASHDLELRGAGNFLGSEQSGHIAAIGYDLYVRMLEEAIASLKGETVQEVINPELKLGVSAIIPEELVPDTQLRLVLYKQLSSAKKQEEVAAIRAEWTDRFGNLPTPVHQLLDLIAIKILARQLRIRQIQYQGTHFLLEIDMGTPIQTTAFLDLVKSDPKKYKILPDGKFVVSQKTNSETEILKHASEILTQLLGAQ